jgi:hypothetical protein
MSFSGAMVVLKEFLSILASVYVPLAMNILLPRFDANAVKVPDRE